MATEESDKRVDMTILCVIIKSGDGTQCEHDLFIVNSSIQLMARVRVIEIFHTGDVSLSCWEQTEKLIVYKSTRRASDIIGSTFLCPIFF